MSDEQLNQIQKQLEDVQGEMKSLHTRHDNHDQQLGYIDQKLERMRRLLVAAVRFDGEAFMKAWRGQ